MHDGENAPNCKLLEISIVNWHNSDIDYVYYKKYHWQSGINLTTIFRPAIKLELRYKNPEWR